MNSSALLPILSNMPRQVSSSALAQELALPKLAAAIDQLAVESRLVLCLHYHEELNFEEIASVLGTSRSVAENIHIMTMAELNLAEVFDVQAGPAF